MATYYDYLMKRRAAQARAKAAGKLVALIEGQEAKLTQLARTDGRTYEAKALMREVADYERDITATIKSITQVLPRTVRVDTIMKGTV